VLGLSIQPVSLLVNSVTSYYYLGRISYPIYLRHPMAVFALIPFYRSVEAHDWPSTISFGICAGVTLVVVIVFATATYTLMEAPGIALGSYVTVRLERRISAAFMA
jgi:peptidoglycan/LPS O-acetylase OafA/YrhL